MKRQDSGFEESYFLSSPKGLSSLIREHKASTSSSPEFLKSTPTSPTIPETPEPVVKRQMSEKSSCSRRRSRDQRRKSIQSSTNTSTKSRDRYGSKPSSRRTSCTLVDPTRPGRHYRVKSSQSVPTVNRDIDDVLALHFRSCTLFQNSTYSRPQTSTITHEDSDPSLESSAFHAMPLACNTAPSHFPSDTIHPIGQVHTPRASSQPADPVPTRPHHVCTTTTWLSNSTRKLEYEKIDRAHSGVRGLVRRIVPRSLSGPQPCRFYEQDKSDVGSVRRYRMDLSDDDDEVDEKGACDEKDMSLLRQRTRGRSREVEIEKKVQPAEPRVEEKIKGGKERKWSCF